MKLHLDEKVFRQAIQFTSDKLQILPIYIEKDYWVTYSLYKMLQSPIKDDIIFKGGTALSKCFGLIERFSEDIDLVILQDGSVSGNQLKNKLKGISNAITEILPEIEVKGITNKKGMLRKTAHSYPKLFKGSFNQVRDFLVIESSWLGSSEPYIIKEINSFIGEVLLGEEQTENIEKYGLYPFEIKALDPRRTMCEKIMSLVRFSYSNNPIQDLKLKIRHTYDLHKLLQERIYLDYLKSKDFEIMLKIIIEEDKNSFRTNNEWLNLPPVESLFFKELKELWNSELKAVYENDFSSIVYGELPDESLVLNSLKRINQRLDRIV